MLKRTFLRIEITILRLYGVMKNISSFNVREARMASRLHQTMLMFFITPYNLKIVISIYIFILYYQSSTLRMTLSSKANAKKM